MELFIDGIIFGIAYALLCLPMCGVLLLSVVFLSEGTKLKELIPNICIFIFGKTVSIAVTYLIALVLGKTLLRGELSYVLRWCASAALLVTGILLVKSKIRFTSTKCLAIGAISSIRICPVHIIIILKAFSLPLKNSALLFIGGFAVGNSVMFLSLGIFTALLKKVSLIYSKAEYLRRVGASIIVIEALLMAIYGI